MSDQDLRNKLIRLAHENPELRSDLLPLLKEGAESYEAVYSHRELKPGDQVVFRKYDTTAGRHNYHPEHSGQVVQASAGSVKVRTRHIGTVTLRLGAGSWSMDPVQSPFLPRGHADLLAYLKVRKSDRMASQEKQAGLRNKMAIYKAMKAAMEDHSGRPLDPNRMEQVRRQLDSKLFNLRARGPGYPDQARLDLNEAAGHLATYMDMLGRLFDQFHRDPEVSPGGGLVPKDSESLRDLGLRLQDRGRRS